MKQKSLLNLVRVTNHQTPYFFTSRDAIKSNYELFTNLFDNCEIYYALKANSEPEVLNFLNNLGCGFEAASAFEVEMLTDIGVDPYKIIYGTSIKPSSHIKRVFELGIDRFAADSREEIDKIAEYAPGARVFIRSIVDDSGSVFQMSERFGAPVETVKDLVLYAKKRELKIYGISFYVGSQATNPNRWSNGLKTILPVVEELLERGVQVEMLNIGGGFPVKYFNHASTPQLAEIAENVRDSLSLFSYKPKILTEPGRGIIGNTTVLVASVISKSIRHGKAWLCLDAGIYNSLYESMIHQGATVYNVHSFIETTSDTKMIDVTLTGPTGDSLDIITRSVMVPEYIDIGDKIIFENTGAYTLTMYTPFNGFPKPKCYFV